MLERFPQVEIDVFFLGGVSVSRVLDPYGLKGNSSFCWYQPFFLMDLDVFLLGDCFADSDPMG